MNSYDRKQPSRKHAVPTQRNDDDKDRREAVNEKHINGNELLVFIISKVLRAMRIGISRCTW